MSKLSSYLEKRDFRRTPEPDGRSDKPNERPVFVVQEHEASTHHFDFRLEIDDVLVSWAVPKGPSTNPKHKRLAIRTEDHPLGYARFEGRIPEDEYGGGTVIVWDGGSYRNLRADKAEPVTMAESLEEGQIEVHLEGEKLTGGYALVRTGRDRGRQRWLLIKMDDSEADARRRPVSTQPESVLSGRTLEDSPEQEPK